MFYVDLHFQQTPHIWVHKMHTIFQLKTIFLVLTVALNDSLLA